MPVTNPIIAGQAVRITTARVPWADLTLVTVVHFLGVAVPTAEVFKVDRAGVATSIGTSALATRDDSAAAEAFDDGTVRLWVSEMDATGGGATCHVVYYDFPGKVPAKPPAASGGVDNAVRLALKAIKAALAPF